MARRKSDDIRTPLTSVYRAQLGPDGHGKLNHSAAAEAVGCTRQTATAHYEKTVAATAAHGPAPSIRDLLAAERADRAAGITPNVTAPSAAPAPTVAGPAYDPDDHAAAEAHLVKVTRRAAEGLAVTTTNLLGSLQPLVKATKKRLEAMATADEADAKFCIQSVGALADSLTKTAAAIERLVNVQSVLSDRPQTAAATRAPQAPPPERLSDEEIKRRTSLIWQAIEERNRINAAELGPVIDAQVTEIVKTTAETNEGITP